jgi:hypothetical protein
MKNADPGCSRRGSARRSWLFMLRGEVAVIWPIPVPWHYQA